jgi:undecaprenyl diphosphate synthase
VARPSLTHNTHAHTTPQPQMKAVIQWCFELGVTTVSVYAFSIDNFK